MKIKALRKTILIALLLAIAGFAGYSIFNKYIDYKHDKQIEPELQQRIDSTKALQKQIDVKKDYFQYKIDSLKRDAKKTTLPILDSLFQ